MATFRLDFEGMQAAVFRFASACLNQSASYPLSASSSLALGIAGMHQRRALEVAHLAFAEQHDERPASAVADGVQFGVQAALGAPDTSGNRPFFKRLAAVRRAFRCVASIMIRCGLPPFLASAAKILLNTPSRLQRMKRL